MSELLNTLYHTDNNPEYFDETDLLKSLPKETLIQFIRHAGAKILELRRLEALATGELENRNETL